MSFMRTPLCRAAQALALQRMLEKGMYWCYVYVLWQCNDGCAVVSSSAGYFAGMPALVRTIVAPRVRGHMIQQLQCQVSNSSIGHGWGTCSVATRCECAWCACCCQS